MKIPVKAVKGASGDTDNDAKQLKKKMKRGLLKGRNKRDPDNDGDIDFPNAR